MAKRKTVVYVIYDPRNKKHHSQGLEMAKSFWKEEGGNLLALSDEAIAVAYSQMEKSIELRVLEDLNGNVVAIGGYNFLPIGTGFVGISSFAVAPNERRKGFGRLIVENIEQEVASQYRSNGAPYCSLYLSCFPSSLGFWLKNGYRTIEVREYDSLMVKKLW